MTDCVWHDPAADVPPRIAQRVGVPVTVSPPSLPGLCRIRPPRRGPASGR
ncbi:hypothetical protein [Methanogenium cariaci]|nr:hypothetical protein [Methanogenium cariaci]